MKIKTNGIEINCVIEGEGPWVTLSHSLACNLSMWDPQMDMLKKSYKVLRFDTRGHGASSAPGGSYTLEQMADDVHGLFAELGIILLLFSVGLELSFLRLWKMRRQVFGLGSLELLVCAAIIAAGLLALGNSPATALALGLALRLEMTRRSANFWRNAVVSGKASPLSTTR